MCPREGVNQTQLEIYCDSIKEHIDINIHIGVWIAIGVLFVLSLLEMALEACGDFMPYHQIFKPIPKEEGKVKTSESNSNVSGDENQIELLDFMPKYSKTSLLSLSMFQPIPKEDGEIQDSESDSNISGDENQIEQDPEALPLQPIAKNSQENLQVPAK